ncbi:hypothetical protein V5N11_027275 [Cardamine amara subsp. amara]|uniref:Reverse transcriptase zinc-binding domain-containing protein n=1 Tax=Cardamine amara subsp. amara TaxID=228776 RepID=A0ABD1B6L1_CARAN
MLAYSDPPGRHSGGVAPASPCTRRRGRGAGAPLVGVVAGGQHRGVHRSASGSCGAVLAGVGGVRALHMVPVAPAGRDLVPLSGPALVAVAGMSRVRACSPRGSGCCKIRLFLWRVLSGAVAVAECLNAHGIQTELRCKLCNSAPESINHVLFHCIPARAAWRELHIPQLVHGFSGCLHENDL